MKKRNRGRASECAGVLLLASWRKPFRCGLEWTCVASVPLGSSCQASIAPTPGQIHPRPTFPHGPPTIPCILCGTLSIITSFHSIRTLWRHNVVSFADLFMKKSICLRTSPLRPPVSRSAAAHIAASLHAGHVFIVSDILAINYDSN